MLNIAITGANGFVGLPLCKALTLNGHKITTITRSQNQDFVDAHHFIIADFAAETDWKNVLNKIDIVIHLAARVHLMHDEAENPLEAFLAVNLHGTVNLAKAAARAGVKRFVYVSSIKVNGEFTDNQPFSEQDAANPQDAYAISKWQAEQALREIEKETGMQVVILRPPLVYGEGVKANFASLLKLVDKKLPLPLANIDNKRSLIYVGNLVDVIIVAATHPNAAGQTYLVSDGDDVSTAELVKRIAFSLDKPACIFHFTLAFMRFVAQLLGKFTAFERLTQSLVINSSKIRQELGWKPPFSMQQGLKLTADWYQKTKDKHI